MARKFTALENGVTVTRWLAQEKDLSEVQLIWSCNCLTLYRVGVLLMFDVQGINGTQVGGTFGVFDSAAIARTTGTQLLGHDYINNLDNAPIPVGYRPNAEIGQIGWQHGDSCPAGLGDINWCLNFCTITIRTDGIPRLWASHKDVAVNNYRQVAPLYWFVNEDGGLFGQDLDKDGSHWRTHKLAGQQVYLASLFGQSTIIQAQGSVHGLFYKQWGNIVIAYQCGGSYTGYHLNAQQSWTGVPTGLPNPLHDICWTIQYHGSGQDQGYPIIRNLFTNSTMTEYNPGGIKQTATGAGENAWGCLIYLTGVDACEGGSKTLTDFKGVSDNVAVSDNFYFRSGTGTPEVLGMYNMIFGDAKKDKTPAITGINQGGIPTFPNQMVKWSNQWLEALIYPPIHPTFTLFSSYWQPDPSLNHPSWGIFPVSVNILTSGVMNGWDGEVYCGVHNNVHATPGLITQG